MTRRQRKWRSIEHPARGRTPTRGSPCSPGRRTAWPPRPAPAESRGGSGARSGCSGIGTDGAKDFSGRLLICSASAWSSVSHDGSAAPGWECKARDGRAGSGHVRRPSSAWSLLRYPPRTTAEAARHAEQRSSPRPGRPCPRTATGPRRSPAAPADDETRAEPVPHQMARAAAPATRPTTAIAGGHRAQEQEPGVVGHQMQPVVLVAQRPANPRVTRLALQRRRRKRRHAPPTRRAISAPYHSQVSPTFGAAPRYLMMRPHHQHGTAPPPRATPHRASPAGSSPVPAPMQPLCKRLVPQLKQEVHTRTTSRASAALRSIQDSAAQPAAKPSALGTPVGIEIDTS